MDTGAQKSVIGKKQALAYCRYHEFKLPFVTRRAKFKFGDVVLPSLTMLYLFFPTPGGIKIIKTDVVDANIPLLIGLDILDEYGWNVLTVQNQLHSVSEGWFMNLVRRAGHVIAEWNDFYDEYYSREQLKKLHLHFMHPSSDKLFSLLRRAKPSKVDEETKRLLKDIADACHACQTYSTRPITFQVRFPDEVVFNKEIRVDIMYLNGAPVLCIVDTGTNFMSARFLTRVNTETIWNTFLYSWALIYSSFPRKMLTDEGSAFVSKDWEQNCNTANITLRHTGTESHNSLASGETYHAMIRRVYNKVSMTYPQQPRELCLAFTIKAINDTAGPNGLVPSLVVFGMLPRLPEDEDDPPSLQDRLTLMKAARKEYESILAEKRVNLALRKNTPPASQLTLIPGQPIYVYRDKPLKKWTGPHRLVSLAGKKALVDLGEKTGPRHFNLAQVKPAKLPSISSLLPSSPLPFQFQQSRQIPNVQESANDSPWSHPNPLPSARLPSVQQLTQGIPQNNTDETNPTGNRIMMTEVLNTKDPRSARFADAKRKELEGLIQRGTFKLVLREDVGPDPNIVPSRFVLAIKHRDDGKEYLKARFVLGGHRDRDKRSIVHNANTLKPVSTRLMLALASILDFDIWTTDINQTYLQSAENLRRKIFVRPDVLELGADELLQVVKPLYGLSDAGDYWGETLTEHHLKELEMKQAKGDFSLFYKKLHDRLLALSGTYVDDILRIGNRSFRESTNAKTRGTFDSKPDKSPPFVFTGFEISQDRHHVQIAQTRYIKKLKIFDDNASFDLFRSVRAQLAWLVHTRPDIACIVSFLSQTTEKLFGMESIRLMNKAIRHVQKTANLTLRFPKLHHQGLHLVVYSDASFNNNKDNTSQLGYIILLTDETKRCSVLHFSSHKSRRVTRSSAAAETLALVDAFDNEYIIKHDLQRILGVKIPLLHLIDSRIVFDVITGEKYTTEKRLIVDIASIREAYKDRTIANIGLILSEHNIADGLTKLTPNHALRMMMRTSRIDHPIEQYVVDIKYEQ